MAFTCYTLTGFARPFASGVGAALLVALLAHPVRADEDDWKFDEIHLKNGEIMRGLIVRETNAEIVFQSVRRKPGRPTLVFPTTLALDPTGKGELLRMQSLDLKPAPWGKDGKGKALSYQSAYFQLVSNAREDIV